MLRGEVVAFVGRFDKSPERFGKSFYRYKLSRGVCSHFCILVVNLVAGFYPFKAPLIIPRKK